MDSLRVYGSGRRVPTGMHRFYPPGFGSKPLLFCRLLVRVSLEDVDHYHARKTSSASSTPKPMHRSKALFEAVQKAFLKTGRPCTIDRYDLHHGHAFFSTEHGPGILFHSCEYPAFDNKRFPFNLGFCQEKSRTRFHPLRNALWLCSRDNLVFVLNTLERKSPRSLLYPEKEALATIYEGDFGISLADVYYAPELSSRPLIIPFSKKLSFVVDEN